MTTIKRFIGLAVLSGGLVAATFSMPAAAQKCDTADCGGSGSADNDGVPDFAATGSLFEAFELAMLSAPSGFLIYDAARPVGDDGIELTGLVMPGGDQDLTADLVMVNSVDRQSLYSGGMPLRLDVVVEGLTMPTDALDLDPATEMLLGETVTMNIALDYAIDGAAMTVNRLSFDVVDLATVGLTLSADGLNPYEFDPSLVVLGMSISQAEITYQDNGAIALLLEQAARLGNTSIDQAAERIVEEMELWALEATSPDASEAYLAFADFMQAAPHPESTLTISLNPSTPFSPLMFMEIADPDAAAQLLGLSISHQ